MPDKLLASFLERGICYGFRIGFNRSSQLKSATSNMGSVFEQPEMVSIHIAEEVAAGRLLPATAIQQSPIGIIPKKNKANKFRMIVDLLSPIVQSINDGICKEDYSFHYASVTDTAQSIVACGCGALMAKLNLKAAYRMVPVHPEDNPLLGIEWDSTV
uniref:Reverse transcriptase domain-containing protein n=1 Tax=Amphimedon queenslandica TaxID=400682 RepID=A0A1X7UBM2_AMPQE